MAALNNKIQNIAPSSTTALAKVAKDLAAKGHDVISLAIGEPDFNTPDVIKSAGIEAINKNITKYTNVDGLPELKEAIAQKYKRDYNANFTADNICVSSGAKHSLHNIFNCILEEGDEAIFFAPYWVSYPAMISLVGAKPVVVNTKFENNFEIDMVELEKHINQNTKAIIINNPNNPTGLVYSRQCIEDLAKLVRKYPNIWIVGDDIYDGLYFDKQPTLLTTVASDLADRYVIASGLSKNYAMTGWRAGFSIAPTMLNDAIKKFQSQTATCACSISQYAGITAMNIPNKDVEMFSKSYKERAAFVAKELLNMPFVDVKQAEGAFYIFPNLQNVITNSKFKNDLEFCNTFLNEEYVAMMPGSAFGTEGFARISCASSIEDLTEAMRRLKVFIIKHTNI